MPAGFETLCAAIVALYVLVALARSSDRPRLARRLLLLAAAAWVGEDSLMHAYAAYSYAPAWSGFLDRTPVLIPCIWPVVVHSAWELAKRLAPGASVRALATLVGVLVFTDAQLIEPIAVRAGLWQWAYPGTFSVPLVGVAGWGYFAGACVLFLESCERRKAPAAAELGVLVVGPLATHVLTVASWWAALRWIPSVWPTGAVAALAWILSGVACGLVAGRAPGARLVFELTMRVPGAGMFGYLLAVAPTDAPLLAYAVAFVPPYLLLLVEGLLSRGRASPSPGTPAP